MNTKCKYLSKSTKHYLIIYLITIILLVFYTGYVSSFSESKITTKSDISNILENLTTILSSPNVGHPQKWKVVQDIREYGKKATPYLIKILDNKDIGKSHYYAIRALGYIKDPASTPILCKKLLDSKYDQRRYAAIALGQIDDPHAVEALKKALTDIRYVREDSLDALIKINSKDAIKAVENYHLSDVSNDLRLQMSINNSIYKIGDTISLNTTLTNFSDKSVLLSGVKGNTFGYLVFRKPDGAFIESVETGLKTKRLVSADASLLELKSKSALEYSFTGKVEMWTQGEKDDHAFVPSESPFLTLNFQHITYHIRKPGEYTVQVVFKQGNELIEQLRTVGTADDKLQNVWQGRVASKPVSFKVVLESSLNNKTLSLPP